MVLGSRRHGASLDSTWRWPTGLDRDCCHVLLRFLTIWCERHRSRTRSAVHQGDAQTLRGRSFSQSVHACHIGGWSSGRVACVCHAIRVQDLQTMWTRCCGQAITRKTRVRSMRHGEKYWWTWRMQTSSTWALPMSIPSQSRRGRLGPDLLRFGVAPPRICCTKGLAHI